MKPVPNTFSSVVNVVKEYAQAMEPYKNRYYKFISENQCFNIPNVPPYDITSGIYGNRNSTPLSVNHFTLDFPAFPHVLYYSKSFLDNDLKGPVYGTIIYENGEEDYRSFTIPESYLQDPDAWEAEVLEHIKDRDEPFME